MQLSRFWKFTQTDPPEAELCIQLAHGEIRRIKVASCFSVSGANPRIILVPAKECTTVEAMEESITALCPKTPQRARR